MSSGTILDFSSFATRTYERPFRARLNAGRIEEGRISPRPGSGPDPELRLALARTRLNGQGRIKSESF